MSFAMQKTLFLAVSFYQSEEIMWGGGGSDGTEYYWTFFILVNECIIS